MADPRVTHYWDSRRVVGARYKNWVPSSVSGPIEWDAYYLYPADAEWTGDAPPMHLVAGRPILETRRDSDCSCGRPPVTTPASGPFPVSPIPCSICAPEDTACAHGRSCFPSPS